MGRRVCRLVALIGISIALASACGARSDMPGGFADGAVVARDASTPSLDARADAVFADSAVLDVTPRPDVAIELPLCRETFEASAGEYCTRVVRVVSITPSRPSCYVDVPFETGSSAMIVFACSGEGSALVSFGDLELRGASRDGAVDVCYATTFDWSDGCTWTSVQRITGSVVAGRLAFTYDESPAGTGCFTPCQATGEIEVL